MLAFAFAAPCAMIWAGSVGLAENATTLLACLLACALFLSLLVRRGAIEQRTRELGDRHTMKDALVAIAERLETTAHRSDLRNPATGLPTREFLFQTMADDMARTGMPRLLAVIRFADIPRLAAFDQASADRALSAFAHRINRAIGRDNVLAQVERDCFGVWFGGLNDADQAFAELRALIYVTIQELETTEGMLSPTVESGVAIYPEDGTSPEQLLNCALAALTRISQSIDSAIRPHPEGQINGARKQFEVEQGLSRAIADDQLSLVYQPVVDLRAGKVIGAEALLRWDHPQLGRISPAEFIPVVERIGLSNRFGLWALNAACREARRWQDEGLSDLKVAVNLSASQLLDPQLATIVRRMLDLHGLAAGALELELTETVAMADAARTSAAFAELSALGVSLAIDDFGTGYSSLSYLKKLRFDKLKIDREFVTEIEHRRDSRAICKALIELGKGLDLSVLAEGTETASEVTTLRELGCNIFQGYFFARPLPGEKFSEFVLDPAALLAVCSAPEVRSVPVEATQS